MHAAPDSSTHCSTASANLHDYWTIDPFSNFTLHWRIFTTTFDAVYTAFYLPISVAWHFNLRHFRWFNVLDFVGGGCHKLCIGCVSNCTTGGGALQSCWLLQASPPASQQAAWHGSLRHCRWSNVLDFVGSAHRIHARAAVQHVHLLASKTGWSCMTSEQCVWCAAG